MDTLQVKFWGVRGSVPVPGKSTVKYGGNTACIELIIGDQRLVFDAGTGLRLFGYSLDLSQKQEINLFLTHPHLDHINGLPFCPAIYIPGNIMRIYGPRTHEMSLSEIINGQMRYTYFPIRTAELKTEFEFVELTDGQKIEIDDITINSKKLNHPVDCLGYRVSYNDKVFVYLGDNEPYFNIYNDNDPEVESVINEMNNKLIDFVSQADILVADAQYTPGEYESKKGWGHSSTHHVTNLAIKGGVKQLVFFHHEPFRVDEELDQLVNHYQKVVNKKGYDLVIHAAKEGAIITF